MANKVIVKDIDLTNINNDDLLTRQEVSKILDISVGTLTLWGRSKIHLPYIKIGRYVRYLRQDINAFKKKIKLDSTVRQYITRFNKKDNAVYINPTY